MRRRDLLLAGTGAPLLAPWALAQDAAYPNKPIRLIVPYPAGGVVDIVARTVAEKMAIGLKQPIVVEARPGANANIGAEAVARSPADGYTLLMVSPFLATNPLLAQGVRWKASDFTGIGLIGAPPNLFIVPASLPVRTLKELVDYARARPGKLNVSNPGIGSSNHLGQELFFSLTGIDMVDVNYKGQPPMMADFFSGQLSFGLVTQALAMPHVKDGKLRALAIGAPNRSPDLPDVPTVSQAGYPEASFLPWYGIAAPAGTPRDIVRRLSDELQRSLASPDVVSRLEKMGTQITPATAEELDALVQREITRWSRVIKERNIKAD
ncbi:MAG: tripartite tricarboxylate transporter substrate binding protein [Burkholderiaceae bacterium]|nr:tripartite tricarboxylate transporter substrate binding protein [Burkholderiaceae bacterium]